MKKWTRRSKKFIGPADCLAAVQWDVTVSKDSYLKAIEDKDGLTLEANFCVNEEARSHWVSRKADLRPLYKVQKELNAFLKAAEEGLKKVEESNA